MKLWFENTYFGGETVPATYINWCASAGCAFWGAEPDFTIASVWFYKVINDWNEWKWEFDIRTNQLLLHEDHTCYLSYDELVPECPDIFHWFAGLDILADPLCLV